MATASSASLHEMRLQIDSNLAARTPAVPSVAIAMAAAPAAAAGVPGEFCTLWPEAKQDFCRQWRQSSDLFPGTGAGGRTDPQCVDCTRRPNLWIDLPQVVTGS